MFDLGFLVDKFIPRLDRSYLDVSEVLQEYERLEIEVKQLTGFNFETLKRLFAAGYTLAPPKYSSMSELAEEDFA